MNTATDYEVIPLTKLHESPTNPRRRFDPDELKKLVASVKVHQVMVPLLVRPIAGHADGFEIVAGARRYRAAKQCGLVAVPCIVRQLQDKEVLEMQLVENVHRQELHPLDEGNGYRLMHEQHGYRVEDLANKLGFSPSYVYGRIQLGKLPAKAQTLLFEGAISLAHAQLLTRIADPALQDKAAADIAKGDSYGGEKPMPYKRAVDYVKRNYRCDLREAPFPQGDKTLLPDVGACGPCPHRTGNQRNLFGGVDGEKDRVDLCTSPKCFERKVRAHWDREKAAAQAKGIVVIEGKSGREAIRGASLVDLKDVPHQDPKRRTWRELTKGQKVEPVLVQGENGEALTMWKRSDLEKAAKANKVKCFDRPKSSTKSSASGVDPKDWERKRAEQERVRDQVAARLLPMVAAKAEALSPEAAWRMVVRDYATAFVVDDVSKRRGIDLRTKYSGGRHTLTKEAQAALEEMTAAQLQGLALELMASENPDAVCKELGVDEKRIESDIKAEEKAKADAAKKAEQALTKTFGKMSPGLTFVVQQLQANPGKTFKEISAAAKAQGLKTYPVEFGRAQVLLGLAKPAAKGKAAKGEKKPVVTSVLRLPEGADVHAGAGKGPGGATRCGD